MKNLLQQKSFFFDKTCCNKFCKEVSVKIYFTEYSSQVESAKQGADYETFFCDMSELRR